MQKKLLRFFLFCFLSLVPFSSIFACHGTSLVNIVVTLNTNDITIDASSDQATCGCGPYYMEVEMIPNSAAFSGNPPVYTSSAWGTAPWFHSLLNVPGYGPPNWVDNCVLEPYFPNVIPFSGLCPGTLYKYRIREIPTTGTPGPWSVPGTFTTPGSALTPVLNPMASPAMICLGGSSFLDALGGGCTGAGTFTWSPSAGLSSPNTASTYATPTVTTTYTVSFYEPNLNQTFIDSVTVTIAPPLVLIGSAIESGCSAFNGSAMVSVSGGVSPYDYLWAYNGDTTNTLSGVGTSSYDVTITDAIGCTDTISVFVGDSCNPVWPGDANDDSIANNFDLLDIAVAISATGTTRANPSIVWNAYPSLDWTDTLASGTNYKSVDCNGDGIIDLNDTTAVLLNYGQFHTFRLAAPVYLSTLPDLSIQFAQDSILTGGSIGSAQIILGDLSQQANNVYGLAFTIHFDPAQIDVLQTSAYPVQSWLGNPAVNLFGADHIDTTGQLAVAFSRFDQTNASGGGPIGAIYFRTTSSLSGTGNATLVPFTITNVRVISANETLIPVNTVNDTITVYDIMLGASQSGSINDLSVSPNPNEGEFNIAFHSAAPSDYRIEVLNTLGQLVYSEELKQVNGYYRKSVQLSENADGIYLVRISGPNGQSTVRVLCR